MSLGLLAVWCGLGVVVGLVMDLVSREVEPAWAASAKSKSGLSLRLWCGGGFACGLLAVWPAVSLRLAYGFLAVGLRFPCGWLTVSLLPVCSGLLPVCSYTLLTVCLQFPLAVCYSLFASVRLLFAYGSLTVLGPTVLGFTVWLL